MSNDNSSSQATKGPDCRQFATKDDYEKYWKYRHLGWNVHVGVDAYGHNRFVAAVEPRNK